jgi:quercetin dioxygenase-like cupin family protein
MTTHLLRFYRDTLAPAAAAELSGAFNRVLYMRAGGIRLRASRQTAALAANCAWHGCVPATIVAGPAGAELYRWELVPAAQAATPATAPALEAPLVLNDAGGYLIRCDRVDFPPGGIAYTHTHRGPGIRCLIAGTIRIESNGAAHDIVAGEPWFEAGPDPVLALASESEPTSFARVMVLPAELLGKSSIRYVLPEDQDKPKRQTYQLFVDELAEV